MFRFTIRDVLWLMVVVALAVGWYVDSQHKRERIERLSRMKWEEAVTHAEAVRAEEGRVWITDGSTDNLP
jgi:hypothetical protein